MNPYGHIRPNKAPASSFNHLTSVRDLTAQQRADFSYNNLRRFFKATLWDRSHLCRWENCKHKDRLILTFAEATLDHILPRAKGGRTRLSNLQLMHDDCNGEKKDSMPSWIPPNARVGTEGHRRFEEKMRLEKLNGGAVS